MSGSFSPVTLLASYQTYQIPSVIAPVVWKLRIWTPKSRVPSHLGDHEFFQNFQDQLHSYRVVELHTNSSILKVKILDHKNQTPQTNRTTQQKQHSRENTNLIQKRSYNAKPHENHGILVARIILRVSCHRPK